MKPGQKKWLLACLTLLAGIMVITWLFIRSQTNEFLYQSANIDAKVLCSGIFISDRTVDDIITNSEMIATMNVPFYLEVDIKPHIDKQAKTALVEMTAPLLLTQITSKTARFYGKQGCVLDADDGAIHFTPVTVESSLPPADTLPWPMGDLNPGPDEAHAKAIDMAKLEQALDIIFANPAEKTMAFLVVHQGRIVAERYGNGMTKDTPLESWSMGKSLAATLIGRLLRETGLSLDAPAPIPAWRNDSKAQITIRNLLNMSSGIEFQRNTTIKSAFRDHLYVYTAGMDTMAYINAKPLEFAPNTVGRYRNSDPLSLMYILKLSVERQEENYLAWPQQHLFDKIGARHFVLEPDPYGLLLISGYDFGVARDWARVGMLYLQDGVWSGERLLPEGFVEFITAPAPAWDAKPRSYGGLFWLNEYNMFKALPEDTFYMAGAGGQYTWVVPGFDLIIVRQGHRSGQRQENLKQTLDDAHALIVSAVSSSS